MSKIVIGIVNTSKHSLAVFADRIESTPDMAFAINGTGLAFAFVCALAFLTEQPQLVIFG